MTTTLNKTLLSKNPQIFIMCYETRNFSAAAHVLGVTQSAVSKDILSLEKALGFELFLRNSRPLSPTPEARILYDFLIRANQEFSRTFNNLRKINSIKPVLRLGILESLALNMGVEIIRRLLPELSNITINTASANVLMQRLRERKLDLIICNDLSRTPGRIFRKKIFTEPSILMLPVKLAATRSADFAWTWEKLATCGLPLVRYWKESGAGEVNDLFMRSHGLVFPERISVDTNTLMVRLVAQGVGWAFTRPTTVLQNIECLPRIAVRPLQPPTLTREVYVLGHEGEFVTESEILADIGRSVFAQEIVPRVLEFAPWLKRHFQKNASK